MTIDKVNTNEEDFNIIGLYSFFNVEDDKNVKWEEFFQLTEDENYNAANNNQIIEDAIKENHLWKQ